jgi:hypothetical protein
VVRSYDLRLQDKALWDTFCPYLLDKFTIQNTLFIELMHEI